MGNTLFSGKVHRVSGETVVDVQTPFAEFTTLHLKLASDYRTQATVIFKREQRLTKLHVERNAAGYRIDIVTPFYNYESLSAQYRTELNMHIIEVTRGSDTISTFKFKATGSITKFHIIFQWDGPKSLFIHMDTTFNGSQGKFKLTTSFEPLRILEFNAAVEQPTNNTKITKASGKFNDKTFKYKGNSTHTPGLFVTE